MRLRLLPTNDISINNSFPFPTPPKFLNVNVDFVALFPPNLNPSSIDDTNMFNNSAPGAAAIEWHHSTSDSPNIRPMFDVVEDPIIRTPDRALRELKYTFHEKCLNKKTNILLDGIGFRYSRGPKSLTWRCTSRSKKVACLAKVISLLKIKHLRIF